MRGIIPTITEIGEVNGDGCKEEIAWIKYFRDEGVKLVNGTDGGEGSCGCSHTVQKEARERMALAHTGKHLSLETRRKIGVCHFGNKYALGRKHTQEECLKISLAKKGKPSNRRGCHLSKRTRIKLSISIKNAWKRKKETATRINL